MSQNWVIKKPWVYQFLIWTTNELWALPSPEIRDRTRPFYHGQASANTVVIFRPTIYTLGCRSEQTMILSADLLEHMDSLFLTGNEIGDLESWRWTASGLSNAGTIACFRELAFSGWWKIRSCIDEYEVVVGIYNL